MATPRELRTMTLYNRLSAEACRILDDTYRPGSLAERRARIEDAHVRELTALAQRIAVETSESVPLFDPSSGGTAARVLVLLQDPSGVAAYGSGFISIDNNDRTAANTTKAYRESDLAYTDALHWNVVPWWVKDPERERVCGKRTLKSEAVRARRYIGDLLELLPRVSVVLLLGAEAQSAWRSSGVVVDATVLAAPHPGAQSWNNTDRITGKRNSQLTIEAFRAAGDLIARTGR